MTALIVVVAVVILAALTWTFWVIGAQSEDESTEEA